MVPIWIKDGKTKRPESPTHYILAANGFFITKTTPYWVATVPVKKISILEPQESSLTLSLPLISAEVTVTMARFFAWIHREHRSEAGMLLWFNTQEKSYRVDVPVQKANSSSIEYTFPERHTYREHEVLIGTFHSHGGLAAYHSSTDMHDELSFDGIHGTFGGFYGFGGNSFELSVQGVVNGHRFSFKPEEVLEGLAHEMQGSKEEKDGISFTESLFSLNRIPGFDGEPAQGNASRFRRPRAERFELASKEPLLPDGYVPPEEWLKNFTKKEWKFFDVLMPQADGKDSTGGAPKAESPVAHLKPNVTETKSEGGSS